MGGEKMTVMPTLECTGLEPTTVNSVAGSAAHVAVTVRLFGMLALLTRERVIHLVLPERATIADVIGELGKRFGRDFVERVLRAPGELYSYCSLFLNGEQVDDLSLKIAPDGAATEIGVILFMASEGG
jgi:hypothetical protein